MASDSEPRKIFFEAPSRPPQKSHFEKQKPVMLLMSNDSIGAQYSSSFLTAPVEKVFFRSVLMMKPHRAYTHDRQSFVSPRLSIYLSLMLVTNWMLIVNCWCDWLKQECVSNCSGWHSVWRTLRKTMTIFSVVSYIMTRSPAGARIADRTAKNYRGHVA